MVVQAKCRVINRTSQMWCCLVVRSLLALLLIEGIEAGSGRTFAATTADNSPSSVEYQLKSAFLFNFMKFVEWPNIPQDKGAGSAKKNEPMVIGIVGEDYFKTNLDMLAEKSVKDRPLKVIRIEGYEHFKSAKSDASPDQYWQTIQSRVESCHMLFISTSEQSQISAILKHIESRPILTVSDIPGFSENHGTIGFVMENNKIRFDINSAIAEQQSLKISSQLLQLARKVYKKSKEA